MLQLSQAINLDNRTIAGSLEAVCALLPKINNLPAIFHLPWGIHKEIGTEKMSFPEFQINGRSLARPGLQCWEGKCLSPEIFAFLCLFWRLGVTGDTASSGRMAPSSRKMFCTHPRPVKCFLLTAAPPASPASPCPVWSAVLHPGSQQFLCFQS